MSFCFPGWATAFSPGFHQDAKATLEGALNKGSKPPVIQGKIEVVELSMGKIPPTLTLLEIGDLSTDRFRGIFRLGYQGDAWIEVRCRVQANPLSHNPHLNASSALPMSAPLLASQPLLVPMTLRLSSLNLRAILILVVSRSKGITLVFKNDPLQNVDVSSTFDSIEVIRGYLQQEIEGQLKELFREDLPGIIHRLSQKWFGGAGMSGQVEMPYRNETVRIDPNDPSTPMPRGARENGEDGGDAQSRERNYFAGGAGGGIGQGMNGEAVPSRYRPPAAESVADSLRPEDSISVSPHRPRKTSNTVVSRRPTQPSIETPTSYTSFPEIENYDPTYGLRPEGLPSHSGYDAFGRLWDHEREGKQKGLGSLMSLAEEITWDEADAVTSLTELEPDDVDDDEEPYVDSDDGGESIEAVDASPSMRQRRQRALTGSTGLGLGMGRTPSMLSFSGSGTGLASGRGSEYPLTPGTMIIRPRIIHAQSQIRAPSDVGISRPAIFGAATTMGTTTAGSPTARAASSVRSSAGGSSVGLGVARSLLNIRTNTSHRGWPNGLTAISPQMKTAPAGGQGGLMSRPGYNRTHSRAESLPMPKNSGKGRGPSKLHHEVTSSMVQGPSYPQAPMNIPRHPSQQFSRQATPSRNRHPSMTYHPLSGSPTGLHMLEAAQQAGAKPTGFILGINESVSQLASLSHSNHTMSPYSRAHEHIAVRSFPHLSRANSLLTYGLVAQQAPGSLHGFGHGQGGEQGESKKVKGKRKRIFRLGQSKEKAGLEGEDISPGSLDVSPEGRSPVTTPDEITPRRPRLGHRTSYGFSAPPPPRYR